MTIKIVAEIGNTHEGSVGLAKQFIKAAASCGVDAVKFQTHIFSAESLPNAPNPPYFKDETREEYFKRTSFDKQQYRSLKSFAEIDCHCDFLSSPFSLEAIELLEEIGCSSYKIASGEVTNIPLLRRAAQTRKRVILSSGMSSWPELDRAVEVLMQSGCHDLILLQCTSEYPCPPEHIGLNVMVEMAERYKVPVGLSDHSLGMAAALGAVSHGAVMIEKHFTLSRLMYGSDAKNSTEPDEFANLVSEVRALETMLNHPIDKNQHVHNLKDMKSIFEKSLVARHDIREGVTIDESMIALKKPGTGISPRFLNQLIGRKAAADIPGDSMIVESQIVGLKIEKS